jgi:hypothetical protein
VLPDVEYQHETDYYEQPQYIVEKWNLPTFFQDTTFRFEADIEPEHYCTACMAMHPARMFSEGHVLDKEAEVMFETVFGPDWQDDLLYLFKIVGMSQKICDTSYHMLTRRYVTLKNKQPPPQEDIVPIMSVIESIYPTANASSINPEFYDPFQFASAPLISEYNPIYPSAMDASFMPSLFPTFPELQPLIPELYPTYIQGGYQPYPAPIEVGFLPYSQLEPLLYEPPHLPEGPKVRNLVEEYERRFRNKGDQEIIRGTGTVHFRKPLTSREQPENQVEDEPHLFIARQNVIEEEHDELERLEYKNQLLQQGNEPAEIPIEKLDQGTNTTVNIPPQQMKVQVEDFSQTFDINFGDIELNINKLQQQKASSQQTKNQLQEEVIEVVEEQPEIKQSRKQRPKQALVQQAEESEEEEVLEIELQPKPKLRKTKIVFKRQPQDDESGEEEIEEIMIKESAKKHHRRAKPANHQTTEVETEEEEEEEEKSSIFDPLIDKAKEWAKDKAQDMAEQMLKNIQKQATNRIQNTFWSEFDNLTNGQFSSLHNSSSQGSGISPILDPCQRNHSSSGIPNFSPPSGVSMPSITSQIGSILGSLPSISLPSLSDVPVSGLIASGASALLNLSGGAPLVNLASTGIGLLSSLGAPSITLPSISLRSLRPNFGKPSLRSTLPEEKPTKKQRGRSKKKRQSAVEESYEDRFAREITKRALKETAQMVKSPIEEKIQQELNQILHNTQPSTTNAPKRNEPVQKVQELQQRIPPQKQAIPKSPIQLVQKELRVGSRDVQKALHMVQERLTQDSSNQGVSQSQVSSIGPSAPNVPATNARSSILSTVPTTSATPFTSNSALPTSTPSKMFGQMVSSTAKGISNMISDTLQTTPSTTLQSLAQPNTANIMPSTAPTIPQVSAIGSTVPTTYVPSSVPLAFSSPTASIPFIRNSTLPTSTPSQMIPQVVSSTVKGISNMISNAPSSLTAPSSSQGLIQPNTIPSTMQNVIPTLPQLVSTATTNMGSLIPSNIQAQQPVTQIDPLSRSLPTTSTNMVPQVISSTANAISNSIPSFTTQVTPNITSVPSVQSNIENIMPTQQSGVPTQSQSIPTTSVPSTVPIDPSSTSVPSTTSSNMISQIVSTAKNISNMMSNTQSTPNTTSQTSLPSNITPSSTQPQSIPTTTARTDVPLSGNIQNAPALSQINPSGGQLPTITSSNVLPQTISSTKDILPSATQTAPSTTSQASVQPNTTNAVPSTMQNTIPTAQAQLVSDPITKTGTLLPSDVQNVPPVSSQVAPSSVSTVPTTNTQTAPTTDTSKEKKSGGGLSGFFKSIKNALSHSDSTKSKSNTSSSVSDDTQKGGQVEPTTMNPVYDTPQPQQTISASITEQKPSFDLQQATSVTASNDPGARLNTQPDVSNIPVTNIRLPPISQITSSIQQPQQNLQQPTTISSIGSLPVSATNQQPYVSNVPLSSTGLPITGVDVQSLLNPSSITIPTVSQVPSLIQQQQNLQQPTTVNTTGSLPISAPIQPTLISNDPSANLTQQNLLQSYVPDVPVATTGLPVTSQPNVPTIPVTSMVLPTIPQMPSLIQQPSTQQQDVSDTPMSSIGLPTNETPVSSVPSSTTIPATTVGSTGSLPAISQLLGDVPNIPVSTFSSPAPVDVSNTIPLLSSSTLPSVVGSTEPLPAPVQPSITSVPVTTTGLPITSQRLSMIQQSSVPSVPVTSAILPATKDTSLPLSNTMIPVTVVGSTAPLSVSEPTQTLGRPNLAQFEAARRKGISPALQQEIEQLQNSLPTPSPYSPVPLVDNNTQQQAIPSNTQQPNVTELSNAQFKPMRVMSPGATQPMDITPSSQALPTQVIEKQEHNYPRQTKWDKFVLVLNILSSLSWFIGGIVNIIGTGLFLGGDQYTNATGILFIIGFSLWIIGTVMSMIPPLVKPCVRTSWSGADITIKVKSYDVVNTIASFGILASMVLFVVGSGIWLGSGLGLSLPSQIIWIIAGGLWVLSSFVRDFALRRESVEMASRITAMTRGIAADLMLLASVLFLVGAVMFLIRGSNFTIDQYSSAQFGTAAGAMWVTGSAIIMGSSLTQGIAGR